MLNLSAHDSVAKASGTALPTFKGQESSSSSNTWQENGHEIFLNSLDSP